MIEQETCRDCGYVCALNLKHMPSNMKSECETVLFNSSFNSTLPFCIHSSIYTSSFEVHHTTIGYTRCKVVAQSGVMTV